MMLDSYWITVGKQRLPCGKKILLNRIISIKAFSEERGFVIYSCPKARNSITSDNK